MQATVKTFDAATRTGSVLTDAGEELPFDAAAFDASDLRLLRFGQRVRLRTVTGPDGVESIVALTIASLPFPDERPPVD